MTFGVHLGIDFHEILDFVIICENHPNAYIQSIWVGSAHSKPHIFRPKFNQKFILFLMPHSGPHFSTFWRVLMPKCSILGPPWRPAGHQMAPKIAQRRPNGSRNSKCTPPGTVPATDLLQRPCLDRFPVPIWIDLGWIFHDFPWNFV